MGHVLKLALGIVLVVIGVGVGGSGVTPVSAAELTPATRELFDAVGADDFPAVRRSLLKGGDVTTENARGLTAVDLAVDKGHFRIAHYLLAWRKRRAPKTRPLVAQPPPQPSTAEAETKPEPEPSIPALKVAPEAQPMAQRAPVPAAPPESAEPPESVKPPALSEKSEETAAQPPEPPPLPPVPEPQPMIQQAPALPGKSEETATQPPEPPPLPPPLPPEPEAQPMIQQAPAEKAEAKESPVPEKAGAPGSGKIKERREAFGKGIIDSITGFFSAGPGEKQPAPDKETAAAPSGPPPPAPQEADRLQDLAEKLYIGQTMKLGRQRDTTSSKGCVEKPPAGNRFCIEPVDWPDEIADAFQVQTTLYRGRKSIIHYENGKARQFHVLFPHGNFQAIVEHFTKRFGEPAESPVIRLALIGEADRKNRTARWLGPGNSAGGQSILEVREFDDMRWSAPPDARHGVVRLYRKGAEPVFQHVSWSDFLLARIRERRE